MSSVQMFDESFQHAQGGKHRDGAPVLREETQPVVRELARKLQVLAPLISDRMDHALGKTFAADQLTARCNARHYTRARSWAAFFLRNHPNCKVNGVRPSYPAIAKVLRRDHSTVMSGLRALSDRMKRKIYEKENWQLKWIAEHLEREHGWEPFDVSKFQGIERRHR